MVPIALSSIVRLSVCNAIDRVVCRAAPSKTRRSSVEVGSHPSLAGAELCPDISHQTSSHSPRENVDHGQRHPAASRDHRLNWLNGSEPTLDSSRLSAARPTFILLPSHGSPSQPVDDLDRVRRLYLQANGSQRGLSFWCRERYVPDVRYLLVQKYDDSTFLFALE